jgi:hypothetical protein
LRRRSGQTSQAGARLHIWSSQTCSGCRTVGHAATGSFRVTSYVSHTDRGHVRPHPLPMPRNCLETGHKLPFASESPITDRHTKRERERDRTGLDLLCSNSHGKLVFAANLYSLDRSSIGNRKFASTLAKPTLRPSSLDPHPPIIITVL